MPMLHINSSKRALLHEETKENSEVGPDKFSLLELQNLYFSYPLRPYAHILRGIDLHVSLLLSRVPRQRSRWTWMNQQDILIPSV